MERQKNVPVLRFPEFVGEWEKMKLAEIAKISSGGTPSRSNPEFWGGDIPWVSTTLIDFNYISEANEYITQEGLENSSAKFFPKNTILMAMYGQGKTRGKVAILGIKATTNQACAAIIPSPEKLNNVFLFQYLYGQYDEIRNISNSGGQENLSAELLKGIMIPITLLSEQTQIANFLTTIDNKIQQLTQKKTLLEEYKKGVMQQLFTQQLRFKDENGEDYPDWEVKKLGEICLITIGEFVIKTKQNPLGKYPVYNGGKSFTGFYDEFNNEGNKIIISARGANAGFVNFQKERYWAGNSCYSIDVIDKEIYNINYFFYFIKMFESNFTENQQAANIPSVSKKDTEKFKINLPYLPEQIKIADFLTAIDTKIETVAKQIEQTQAYKKGLLQQLFI